MCEKGGDCGALWRSAVTKELIVVEAGIQMKEKLIRIPTVPVDRRGKR
jgi:hypothetical protein